MNTRLIPTKGDRKALIVVDMLEEFVSGRLGSDKSQAIVPVVAALCNHAQKEGWQVVFANDSHQPGDPECELWGEHAIHDTPEAGLSTDLLIALDQDVIEQSWISTKSEYDAFGSVQGALLSLRLKDAGVSEVVIVGTAAHICVAQTAIGAFQNDFKVTVVADAVAGFADTDEKFWLDHIRAVTGADVPFAGHILAGVKS